MPIYTPTIKKIHDNTDEQMTLVGMIVRPLSGGEDMGPSPVATLRRLYECARNKNC